MATLRPTMEHVDRQTSQNIKNILKDIGELSCPFYLYYKFNHRGWSVYKNYNEKGYDILLMNEKNHQKKKIEIKTRQKLISSPKNRNQITHFTLTELEKNEADYLVGLWYEHHLFFIVPTSELKSTKSNDKRLYKFIVSISEKGKINPSALQYLNNWDCLIA